MINQYYKDAVLIPNFTVGQTSDNIAYDMKKHILLPAEQLNSNPQESKPDRQHTFKP